MKKMWKMLGVFCFACGLLFAMSLTGTAAEGNIPSGVIDESYGQITWGIDWKGHLTVEGTGDLTPPDRGFEDVPWYKCRERILSAKISVRGMKNASFLFAGCKKLKHVDLNDFQTENVTNMSYMFGGCEALERIDWKKFNTDRVTNMAYMFYDCKSLKALDVSGFHTRNVKSMNRMFAWCESLKELDVSGFDTSNANDLSGMFIACKQLKTIDVSGFDTSKVSNLSAMFNGCYLLERVDVSGFDTSKVTYMADMFSWCHSLKYVDVSGFDTSKVTDMYFMFAGCESLKTLDVSGFDTSKVTHMYSMFEDCKSLQTLDVSGFDTSNVEYMAKMFKGCWRVKKLDVSGFDTSKVKDFRCMFQDCANITELDLSNFELGAPHSYMLTGCWKLEKLRTPKKITYSYEVLGLPLQYQTQQWYDDQGKTCTVVKSGVSKSFLLTKIENQNFRDVYNDWYREYVTYVSKKGLMKGYNQFFSPNDAITRGMVVQTLYNMEGRPEVTDYKACLELKDVYQDWYTDAVCWAYNEGITTGYDDTKTFETDKSVTREELAAFLYRYAMYKEYNSSQQGDLGNLQNVDKVSPYAKDAVSWAVGAGLISGIEIKQYGSVIAKDLAPQGTATRAQMAAILMRFCEAYQIQLPDKQLGIPEDAFEWKGHCYAIFDNVSTWELAKVYCEAKGGHLAAITSPEENEAVYSFIKENGYTSAYFGLSDTAKEGTWSWVNGETTDYTNWNAEEPGGGTDENYAMFFYLYEDGTWNDGAFKENVHDGGNAYICEWE